MLGKNFAPLAEKLNNVEWGKFLLKDLFEIKGNPQLNKDNFSFSENGEYPYFTRTVFNNGILGYVDYFDEEHKISGNCLAVGMIGMQFFYMEKDFYAGQFTKRAVPKNFSLTKKTALFFISLLSQYQKIFQEKLVRDFEKTFYQIKIKLPTKNGEIDFEFMEKFITELESERITELEAYLTAAGLKDFILTDEEKFALENLNSCIWQKFYLTEIFKMANTKSIVKEKIIPESGKIPYVTASAENNGVMTYINCPDEWIDKGNCIMIGGKTLTFTFQEKDFCSNDSHNIVLYAKNSAEKILYLFYMSALRASMQNKYSWGNSISMKKIQDDIFYLPTKDGEPDFEYMEKFISAVQKIVIAEVVKYSEEKMSAYRQAVNK